MKPGDKLTVTAAGIADTPAELLELATVDELPDLPAQLWEGRSKEAVQLFGRYANAEDVRCILREMGVTRVALLAYDLAGQQVCFVALDFSAAGWRDLQGTQLTIEPRQEIL